ncbi:MAG: methyltransferase domain-containing protein [bacterium]
MVDIANLPGKRFSAAAASYDRHSELQSRVARRLLDFIPAGKDYDSILEIGCGTGIYTKMLLERFSGGRVRALDISARMIERARKKIDSENVNWLVENALSVRLVEPVGLITGSAVVHWVKPLAQLFNNLFKQLKSGGELIINVMLADTLKELHTTRELVAPDKFTAPPLPQLPEVIAAIKNSGFDIEKTKKVELKQNYRSGFSFLKALNEQGVTAGPAAELKPLNFSEIKQLASLYDNNFSDNGRVYASYEVLFLRAKKR